jgi:parvulin-like peptidyl-prolyl isomerase
MITLTCFIPVLLAAPPAGADVLATYAGGTVTRAEYESFLLGQGEKDDESARRARLETVALSESLEAAAVAAGLDREPQTAFRLAQIENGALAAALRQGVDRAITIGDAEVEAELKAEDAERFKPRTVRLRNLFKRVPAGASEAVRAEVRGRMEQLRKDLLAGADFEDLAWRESDSQTRFRGGAMGYVPAGVLSPDVDRVIATLKKGDLSAVLASADGFTILRCDDIDEGRVIPLDEARQTIRQGLWSRASAARQAELRADLLREAAPRYAATGGDDASSAVDFQGGRITRAELRWLAGGGADALPAEERQRLLEEQVVRVAAAARARARGLDRDPALRARVAWQRARHLATEEIARRLNRSLVPPTEAEMRAHHQQNREKYMEPVRVDISLIAWPLEKDQARRRFTDAEAVLARLKAGELAFDAAARQGSVHPSAANGGRIGLLPMTDLAQLGPNVFRTVQELAPGETSAVVQQDARLFVVKLWERRPARPLTYEEAAPRVEKELGDARVAELQKAREAEAREALRFELARAVP